MNRNGTFRFYDTTKKRFVNRKKTPPWAIPNHEGSPTAFSWEALDQSKCIDWRADFLPDEGKIAGILDGFQDFLTKYGGKSAAKMCAAIDPAFP